MEPSKTKPRPIGIPDKFSNDRPQNSPMGSDMKPKSISTYDNKTNNNNNNKTSGDSKFNNNNNNNNTIDKNPPQHHNANPFHKAQSIVPVNDVVEVDLAHLKGLPEF